MTNLEYGWFKKLTFCFRVPEAKLRLLDSIKTKQMMVFCKITKNIQFKSQEEAFSSSIAGNKVVIVKEEMGYNFKNSFRKPSENFTDSKGNGHLCNRCGVKPHSSRRCPALNKKCDICENVRYFAK